MSVGLNSKPKSGRAENKYKLFANYVRGTADCSPGDAETAAGAITSAMSCHQSSDRLELTADAIRTLHLAWGREWACLGHEDPAIRRAVAAFLANSVYYALLSAHNVTYTLAKKTYSRDNQHGEVAEFFRAEREGLAPPWSLGLQGNPGRPETLLFRDARDDRDVEPSPLRYPASWNGATSPETYALAALKSARRFSFAEFERKQLAKMRRTQFTEREVTEIYAKIYETTVLDFTKELRERADYKGAEELGANVSDDVVDRYYTGLRDLLHTGLLVAEARIIARVGWDAYETAAHQWLTRTYAAQTVGGLAERLEILRPAAQNAGL